MEMINLIHKRRSIRKYNTQPINDNDLKTILSAGMTAPSAWNKQPWEFIVIKDNDVKNEIVKINPYSAMALQSPVSILVCANVEKSYNNMYPLDCAAAIQNILLSSCALNIGSVWTGIYGHKEYEDKYRELFKLPQNILPIALIVLGYSDEKFVSKNYFDVKKIHNDKW